MDDDRRPAPAVPGYRLERGPDPETVGEDAALRASVRAEIAERGPITFARFMELALYAPGHGYYRRAASGPGLAGADFLTAPEAHPIFGTVIGRLLETAWEALDRPAPFTVTEQGAGSGALADGMLDGLRRLGSPLFEAVRYRPVDVEDARVAATVARLERAGLAAPVTTDVPEPRSETGAVVANEVLDALPVHRVVGRGRGIRELLVSASGDGLGWMEAKPTTDALAARLGADGVTLEDGQVAEVCLVLDGWLAAATGHLSRGVLVLVDYAEEPRALYRPERRDGTLRVFARHAVGGDPLRHLGRQDITATVDAAAVRAAARNAGLEPLGETSQAELLAALGSGAPVEAALRGPGATLQDALALRSALARLLDPSGMGAFRVFAFGRGMPAGARLAPLRAAASVP